MPDMAEFRTADEKIGVNSETTMSVAAKDEREGEDHPELAGAREKIVHDRDLPYQRLHIGREEEGDHGRRNPSADGQRLAHEAAGIGEDRRQHDDHGHDPVNEGETFHSCLPAL